MLVNQEPYPNYTVAKHNVALRSRLQPFKKFPLLLIVLLTVGCAGYNFEKVEMGLESGKPTEAYDYLKKNSPKKPDIPHHFELGLTGHYANQFEESSAAFDLAEDIAEDRWTKSVSVEALSLVTSDQLRPYPGTKYERLLSHYYSILNYIYDGSLEGALVECKQATNLIQYFKDEEKDYNYFAAGFLAHFCGMVFEAAGELNDALISYKQAADYYKHAASHTSVSTPDDVGHALVRISRKLGFTDEYTRFHQQYGDSAQHPENYGELILFYETGYVPHKTEESLTFPILTTDKFGEKDNKDSVTFARTLRAREGMVVDEIKLEYLLRVAIPTIRSHRPHFAGIKVSVEDQTTQGVLIEDVENMAIKTVNAQRPIILIRTLARALGKYLIFREAKKKSTALGLVANLAGVLTESADTRSWQTLPNQIYLVRMPLPAGTHRLKLSFLNANGTAGNNNAFMEVQINANQISFLNYRTYD